MTRLSHLLLTVLCYGLLYHTEASFDAFSGQPTDVACVEAFDTVAELLPAQLVGGCWLASQHGMWLYCRCGSSLLPAQVGV